MQRSSPEGSLVHAPNNLPAIFHSLVVQSALNTAWKPVFSLFSPPCPPCQISVIIPIELLIFKVFGIVSSPKKKKNKKPLLMGVTFVQTLARKWFLFVSWSANHGVVLSSLFSLSKSTWFCQAWANSNLALPGTVQQDFVTVRHTFVSNPCLSRQDASSKLLIPQDDLRATGQWAWPPWPLH